MAISISAERTHLRLGKRFQKRLHQLGHDDGRERGEPPHRELAAHLLTDVRRGGIEPIGLFQQLLGFAQQGTARGCQRQSLRVMPQE
jgi:hypothetical protein